jgi:hypothetical protein
VAAGGVASGELTARARTADTDTNMQTIASMQQVDFVRLMQSPQMRRVILVVNVLLVIWIATQLATLTWGFLAPAEETATAVVETAAVPVQRNEELELIRQIPGWHLLGVVTQQAAAVVEAVPIEAPDTRLKLVLRGALASDDPQHARAIIADPRGKEEQYAIGDNLPGNAELSEVHPDRVILKRNGRYETLRLPQDQKQQGNNTVSGRRPLPAPRSVCRISASGCDRTRCHSMKSCGRFRSRTRKATSLATYCSPGVTGNCLITWGWRPVMSSFKSTT